MSGTRAEKVVEVRHAHSGEGMQEWAVCSYVAAGSRLTTAFVLEVSVSKHDTHEGKLNLVWGMSALEMEVHGDIHLQPPLHHSGVNGRNPATAG